jgi:putative tricarboxylic transport membrane protein
LDQEEILYNRNFFSSLFWVLCSVLIILGSLRLPIGELHNPGPGFLPLWVGVLMAILAIVLLRRSVRKKTVEEALPASKSRNQFKLIGTFLAMLIYVPVFYFLGFIFATIPLMVFLFKVIGQMGWKISLVGGIFISLSMYMIFQVWLQVRFPVGLWGGI